MMTRAEEAMIRSLHRKKGRDETGLCLVEGKKVIETAGEAVEMVFSFEDTPRFADLVTTDTPQELAATARIPQWTQEEVLARDTVIVLDGVQDPGNVGAILRLCLGFDAGLILVESADPASPKVIRASVGAMFQVPWIKIPRQEAGGLMASLKRPVYRLERSDDSRSVFEDLGDRVAIIAGSEGQGIQLAVGGTSLSIPHNDALESLNVGHALAISLAVRYQSK